jgi:hypothetical protein
MSSPLAIAAVTAVLKDLLNNGLINHDLSTIGSFTVSALPPDRITTGPLEPNQLNLFLYQVTANQGWRNVGLPSRDSNGARLTNPPLALDLHYLLTAYGAQDFNAEILLGYALQLLHETPVLARKDIRTALGAIPNEPPPVGTGLLPSPFGNLSAVDLADQVEQIKITPQYLTTEELSKLWTAMQARYRPTMAYQVSVVLIQSTLPTKAPLPVLQRGKDDSGVSSQPDLAVPPPPFPTLSDLVINDALLHHKRPSAELGDDLTLSGYHLNGDEVRARFKHLLLVSPNEIGPITGGTERQLKVSLPKVPTVPDAPAKWPAGVYSVSLLIKRTGKPDAVTNELPFTLAPRIISALPPSVARDGSGNATINLTCSPEVRPKQRASLLLGGREILAAERTVQTPNLTFTIKDAPITEQPIPIRLRVDGVDSLLVRDYEARPLKFDPNQAVSIT